MLKIPCTIDIIVEGQIVRMELDTGAAVSLILIPTEVCTYPHKEDKSTVKDLYRGANMPQGGVASQSEEGRQRVDITPIGSGRTRTTFDRVELVGKYPTGLENDQNCTMQRRESESLKAEITD